MANTKYHKNKSSGQHRGTQSSGRSRQKRRYHSSGNLRLLPLLLLIAIVLVLFEGRLIYTMFTQSGRQDDPPAAAATETEKQTEKKTTDKTSGEATNASSHGRSSQNGSSIAYGLAGLSTLPHSSSSGNAPAETESNTISEALTGSSIVPLQSNAVDNSYFNNAVFIGDSRMEGFRNASGITTGDFLTSIGMALTQISSAKVNTPDGPITVYQGLSGKQYSKVYLMLGANDLGFYGWETFLDTALSVFEQIHELQPKAIIYICSVIYVEESKVTTDYVNNANVIKINGYLQEAAQTLDYCYYLNLNEIFSNGYQSLIEGASADGVHLNAEYLEQMLDYLKNHYIEVEETEDVTENETE